MNMTSCSITLQPGARRFAAEAGETLLDAALRHGIGLPYGCRDGICGSCKCQKLSGRVQHRPHSARALSHEEAARGLILPCRATACGPVALHSDQVADSSTFVPRKMPLRVAAMERLAPDIMRLVLHLPVWRRFEYHAGQYLDLLLPDGARRSYSMACAPHVCHGTQPLHALELHIRHLPGGLFTDALFGGAVRARDILRAYGPLGGFFLRQQSNRPIIFVASGTGLAPILAMLEHLQASGCQRPAVLYRGARTAADLYMEARVQGFECALPQLQYVPVLSREQKDGCRHGRLHEALRADFSDLSGHEVYACGAPRMVDSVRQACTALGLPAAHFFSDAFVSCADMAAVRAKVPDQPGTPAPARR